MNYSYEEANIEITRIEHETIFVIKRRSIEIENQLN